MIVTMAEQQQSNSYFFRPKNIGNQKITKITIYTKAEAEKIYPCLIFRKINYFCRFCFHLIYFVWLKLLGQITLFLLQLWSLVGQHQFECCFSCKTTTPSVEVTQIRGYCLQSVRYTVLAHLILSVSLQPIWLPNLELFDHLFATIHRCAHLTKDAAKLHLTFKSVLKNGYPSVLDTQPFVDWHQVTNALLVQPTNYVLVRKLKRLAKQKVKLTVSSKSHLSLNKTSSHSRTFLKL